MPRAIGLEAGIAECLYWLTVNCNLSFYVETVPTESAFHIRAFIGRRTLGVNEVTNVNPFRRHRYGLVWLFHITIFGRIF